MPLRAILVALVLGVFASQARAADLVGYAEAYNVLYSVDLTTRTAVMIGDSGLINGQQTPSIITGLTASPTGALFAVWDAGPAKLLVTVDKGTGLVAPLGALNVNSSAKLDLALAFTCDGKLWMSASTGQFWSVDPATANVTALGNLGVDITGLAARGSLLIGAGSQGNNNLYSIDPVKVTATLIGGYQTANYITITSPGFDASGNLWAVLDYVPPPGGVSVAPWSDLAQVSPTSGTLVNLGNITPPASTSDKSPTYYNLFQVGLRGLAIPSSVCSVAASTGSTPALSWRGMAALIALLLLVGGTRLRLRRPSP
ncbi:MAG: hypothetical protein JSS28_02350 [Proteobacteria bacterium]|nr:hypothetical protein [Pseudomonadota bacterium]